MKAVNFYVLPSTPTAQLCLPAMLTCRRSCRSRKAKRPQSFCSNQCLLQHCRPFVDVTAMFLDSMTFFNCINYEWWNENNDGSRSQCILRYDTNIDRRKPQSGYVTSLLKFEPGHFQYETGNYSRLKAPHTLS